MRSPIFSPNSRGISNPPRGPLTILYMFSFSCDLESRQILTFPTEMLRVGNCAVVSGKSCFRGTKFGRFLNFFSPNHTNSTDFLAFRNRRDHRLRSAFTPAFYCGQKTIEFRTFRLKFCDLTRCVTVRNYKATSEIVLPSPGPEVDKSHQK